jgi:hypothetical protein
MFQCRRLQSDISQSLTYTLVQIRQKVIIRLRIDESLEFGSLLPL